MGKVIDMKNGRTLAEDGRSGFGLMLDRILPGHAGETWDKASLSTRRVVAAAGLVAIGAAGVGYFLTPVESVVSQAPAVSIDSLPANTTANGLAIEQIEKATDPVAESLGKAAVISLRDNHVDVVTSGIIDGTTHKPLQGEKHMTAGDPYEVPAVQVVDTAPRLNPFGSHNYDLKVVPASSQQG